MKKWFAKAFNGLTACLIAAVCLGAACFALSGAASVAAFAEENVLLSAGLINNNQAVSYKYIPKITAFGAKDFLYFSDGTALYKDSEHVSGAGAVTATAVFEGKLIYAPLSGGIYYKSSSLTDGMFDSLSIDPITVDSLAVLGQTLYAAAGNTILTFTINYTEASDTLALAPSNTYDCVAKVQNLCATSAAVYYKLKDRPFVSTITAGGNKELVDSQIEGLEALSANGSFLYCLTNKQIISYADNSGILSKQKQLSFSGGEFIAAATDYVYTATKDGNTYTIYRATLNLSQIVSYMASRGDFEYFYRAPAGVTSRFGLIYVADTNNNRIAALSDLGAAYYESYIGKDDSQEHFYEVPKSVAVSIGGDLYVAHKDNLTNNTTGKNLLLKDGLGNPLVIQKILIDTNGNIYALAKHPLSGESFAYSSDSELSAFTKLSFNNPLAMGFKVGGDVLFYEGGAGGANGTIKNLKGESIASCPAVKDFCVDYSGKIFGINLSGNLISVSGSAVTNHGGSYDTLSLSNIACSLAGFGDILLIDSATNSLKKISASAAGVADIEAQFNSPDAENAANDTSPHIKTDNFVASVKFNTPLFAKPTEANAEYTLTEGTDVFIRRDIDSPQDMYFVVAERKNPVTGGVEEGRLIYGYVYKSALNPPYPYVQPQKNTGRIILDTGIYNYIYKYPSFYAKPVREVKNGDWVKLLYFAVNNSSLTLGSWFQDCNGHKWVRVELGDCEGYIPETGLSWSIFTSNGSQPNLNATIKDNAPLYVYDAVLDTYVYLDSVSFLKKGMRVEVATPFDSSAKYTRVYFTMTNASGETEVIDIECYVETKHINFDGVDILQIVAIISIGISIILIIVLIFWLKKRRKRRAYAGYEKYERE